MIKAYKYTHHYIHDDQYAQTEEIFIPDYRIAVCIINDNICVTSEKTPRTDDTTGPLIEIKVSEEDAYLFQELGEAQRVLEELKKKTQVNLKKYLK